MNARDDTLPGLVILVFGVAVVAASRTLSYQQIIANDPLSPATFPTALGILLSVCGTALVVRSRLRHSRRAAEAVTVHDDVAPFAAPSHGGQRVAAILSACVVFAILMPVVGFAISAPLLVVAITLMAAGAQRLLFIVCLAIGLAVGCYLVFGPLLGLPIQLLPSSP